MSFFPSGFNPRDHRAGLLDLCLIDSTAGVGRFIIGADGVFTDTNGDQWFGSQLINAGSLGASIGGAAPEGSLTLSYFQDPNADDLISDIKELGVSCIEGRAITFYVQPVGSMAEFYAPTVAPIQWMQRTMRTLTFSADGAQGRSISLTFEAWTEQRKGSRRVVLNTQGHAQLIGESNPSLEFIPTVDFQEEKLFG